MDVWMDACIYGYTYRYCKTPWYSMLLYLINRFISWNLWCYVQRHHATTNAGRSGQTSIKPYGQPFGPWGARAPVCLFQPCLICLILWMLAKSCTTLDGWNPIDNRINHLPAGARFLPSTVGLGTKWYKGAGISETESRTARKIHPEAQG